MEQSLKHAVKRSLQELSKAINGDSKTEPQTLFTVQILLIDGRVTYQPSMVNLTHSVNIVAKDIISIVMSVPRIRSQNYDSPTASAAALPAAAAAGGAAIGGGGGAEGAAAPVVAVADEKFKSYYEMISDDNDILRIVVQVSTLLPIWLFFACLFFKCLVLRVCIYLFFKKVTIF